MSTNLPDYRAMSMAFSYKRVRITEVNTEKQYVEGRDATNQSFRMTLAFYDSAVQIPAINEDWLIAKLDNNWWLQGRFESGTETYKISNLVPGDIRVEAPNHLFLEAGGDIIIDFSKIDMSTIVDSSIPGEKIYGTATLDTLNVGTINVTNSTTSDTAVQDKIFIEVYS